MKKMIAVSLSFLLLMLVGCGSASESTASTVVQIESVEDLLSASDVIVMAEYTGKYETVGYGNGVITIENATFDDTTYYALCDYKVLDVIQGDEKMLGQTITVQEYLGVGEEVILPMAEACLQYYAERADEASSNMGCTAEQPPARLRINPYRLLLCMKYDAEEERYSVPIPEKCINTVTYEDTIYFTTPLEGSDANIPVETLQTMAKEVKR